MIDEECPLCRHEGRLLAWLDRGRGRLAQINIAAPDFEPERYGVELETVMGEIHGVTASGELVTGMEVFRRAYRAVGLGWLWAPTKWPGLRFLFDAGYRWFARNRLRLTGRPDPCATGRCKVR